MFFLWIIYSFAVWLFWEKCHFFLKIHLNVAHFFSFFSQRLKIFFSLMDNEVIPWDEDSGRFLRTGSWLLMEHDKFGVKFCPINGEPGTSLWSIKSFPLRVFRQCIMGYALQKSEHQLSNLRHYWIFVSASRLFTLCLMYFLLACKVIQWPLFGVTPSMSQDSCWLVANSYLRVCLHYTYHSLASSWRVYSTKTPARPP